MDVGERFKLARDLVESGEYRRATDELTWLWNHMLDEDPSYSGVRSSYLAAWMKRLAEVDPQARSEFRAIRDTLTKDIDAEYPEFNQFMDWLTLSGTVLDDDESIERWVNKRISAGGDSSALQCVRIPIMGWLYEHERWADAGRLLEPGSVAGAEARVEIERERHADQINDEIKRVLMDNRFELLIRQHVSYLAAGRGEEAWFVVDVLLEAWDEERARSALCRAAIDARVTTPRHAELARHINDPLHSEIRAEIESMFPDS